MPTRNLKRYSGLMDQVSNWGNLLLASQRAERGKRSRTNVIRFRYFEERELLSIQRDLKSGKYRPGPFRSFEIFEPKRRLISAAPYRDRVVHHALCQVLEPIYERGFISDSYACRKGKGTHAAIRRAHLFSKNYAYILKCDVKQFFPSIDHEVLFNLLQAKIKDRQILELLKSIILHRFPGQTTSSYFPGDSLFTPIERSCGLPIGNQTSQFFGNVMLNPIDYFVKRQLNCSAYVRYADDFIVFSNSKQELERVREEIIARLSSMRLRLNENKCVIYATRCSFPFLGFRVFPTHLKLSSENVRKQRRRLRHLQRQFERGEIEHEMVKRSFVAWWGHAQHADSWHLLRSLLREFPFLQSACASSIDSENDDTVRTESAGESYPPKNRAPISSAIHVILSDEEELREKIKIQPSKHERRYRCSKS